MRNAAAIIVVMMNGLVGSAQPASSKSVPEPKFEVASIRPCEPAPDAPDRRGGGVGVSPGALHVTCMPLMFLIQDAYIRSANAMLRPVETVPISGGPSWIHSERYDIEAKAAGTPSGQIMEGPMMQALLEDRFKLKIHRETKEVPVYELTVAKGGFKLQPIEEGGCAAADNTKPAALGASPAEMLAAAAKICGFTLFRRPQGAGKPASAEFRGLGLDELCAKLVQLVDRPVINETGIAGLFDFHVDFAPDEATPRFTPAPGDEPSGGPSIFTAFLEQLGLKLEPAKGPGEFLIIDSVEKPSEN